jgi:uncharacterized protein (TIGR02099 family)
MGRAAMKTLCFVPLGVRVRRIGRGLFVTAEWLFWIVFFLFALSVLALRFVVLPSIENYRPRIEATLTKALGAQVSIGQIRAGWQGLHPELDLADVKVLDARGRPALVLPTVEVSMSWWSVPRGELRLHGLDIAGADLDIRRLADGRVTVGGIELKSGGDGAGSDWILSQRRISIRESRLRWNDEKRGAPELALSNISLALENSGDRHRFGLSADPPQQLASRLDVRADLHGQSLNELRPWRGEIYTNLAFIDLAAWRPWLDYPADVQAGAGGLRAWAGFNGDRLEHFTADVSLDNAAVRLRADLPILDLTRVSGRVSAREIASGGLGFGFLRIGEKKVTGFEVSGRQVALTTTGGVSLNPADFSVTTTAARGNEPQRVEMSANSLDLEPLARLVENLPLDESLRRALVEYNPRGAVYDFRLAWRGPFDAPRSYTARGRFADLSLAAHDKSPGFEKLSGAVDATEKGGTLTLASRDSALLLPGVYEEPRLPFDLLNVQAKWAFPNDKLEVNLDSASFSNADAAGTASGLYRVETGTPGYVDIQARITRAEGKRVYRYMPIALSQTRGWLQKSIDEGAVDEARLILRGNLRDYPYLNPKLGLFRVNVKVRDVGMIYAEGWPRLEKIRADLLFEKNFMEIHAQSAAMRGTRLNHVDVRIPDLAGRPHILEVQGAAEGTTTAFLDFIGASPVDRYIDGFTETVSGTGNGRLSLKMTLPIEESGKVKVAGQYQFIGADLKLDEGLPQLSKVNGALDFTEKGIAFKNIRGEALGGPFTINGGTRGDGLIAINAQGNFTAPGLRTWLTEPVFTRVSGGAPWRAAINLRKKTPEITIDTTLVGVAVDLPAPFTKAAADALPLRVTKSALPARGEDELAIVLDRTAVMRLQRRSDGNNTQIARGTIGIGDAAPQMPRAGLAINLATSRVDIEDWTRRLLEPAPTVPARPAAAGGTGAPGSGTATASAPAGAPAGNSAGGMSTVTVSALNLRADALTAYGRTVNQVRLTGGQESGAWAFNIASRELSGELNFRAGTGNAQGKLAARLKTLIIPPGEVAQVDNAFDRASDDLPSIDIVADNFEANNKKFGKLTLLAENRNGEWALQKVALENPDGALTGSGAWRVRQRGEAKRRIDLNFTLEAHDAGKLLDRLGFPGTLRGGTGKLTGDVGWVGSPLSIDYASMRGGLSMNVKRGQFLKADPGVGKLLGIMSLQALPRRLTLDFRDVFSEGFAFDEVSATSNIVQGVLSTTDFRMSSPAAAVVMSGEVDLVKETQKLKLVVLPDLSGGMSSVVMAALGAVNPFVALGSIVVQRILKDPLAKAFSFEYEVSGTWADPKVAQIRKAVPGGDGGNGSSDGVPPNTSRAPAATGTGSGNVPAGATANTSSNGAPAAEAAPGPDAPAGQHFAPVPLTGAQIRPGGG